MMNRSARYMFGVLISIGLTLAVSGCGGAVSGGGPQKAAGMSGGLLKAQAEMMRLKDQIAQTNAALKDMITDPQRDLRPQYKTFANAVKKTDAMVKKIRERTVTIQAGLDKYIDDWRDQVVAIQDPNLRQQALERVNQAKASFSRLYTLLTGTKEILTPYVGNLKDIQRYLDTDLTPAGLKTIQSMADKASSLERSIVERIDAAAVALERVASELASGLRKAGT